MKNDKPTTDNDQLDAVEPGKPVHSRIHSLSVIHCRFSILHCASVCRGAYCQISSVIFHPAGVRRSRQTTSFRKTSCRASFRPASNL